MSKPIKPLAALGLLWALPCLLIACKAPRETAYFHTLRRDTVLQKTISKNFDLRIIPGDMLAITIASASPELSALYNAAQTTGAANGTGGGYTVGKTGAIELYKIGPVQAAGFTKDELKNRLQKELSPYLKEPVVAVSFVNHKVTVLGQVGSPGVLPLTSDQITLLEAIGASGDLTKDARSDNLLLIRQVGEGKEFKRLNLNDQSIFTSPYFYLQNEDVLYVEADQKRKNGSNIPQIISYAISGISLVTLLLSRIK